LRIRGARPSGCNERRDALHQDTGAGIGRDDVPAAVDGKARIRFVRPEHPGQAVAHGSHVRIIQRAFRVDGREARRQQHLVLLTQRHVQHSGNAQDHGAARHGATGLHEADVA
jgi:hypothetical protein